MAACSGRTKVIKKILGQNIKDTRCGGRVLSVRYSSGDSVGFLRSRFSPLRYDGGRATFAGILGNRLSIVAYRFNRCCRKGYGGRGSDVKTP